MNRLLSHLLLLAGPAAVRGAQCANKYCVFENQTQGEFVAWENDTVKVANLPMVHGDMRKIIDALTDGATVRFSANLTNPPKNVKGTLDNYILEKDNTKGDCVQYFLKGKGILKDVAIKLECCGVDGLHYDPYSPCTIGCKCYDLSGVSFNDDFMHLGYGDGDYDYDYDDFDWMTYRDENGKYKQTNGTGYDDDDAAFDDDLTIDDDLIDDAAFDDDDDDAAFDDDEANGRRLEQRNLLSTKCCRRRHNRQLLSGMDLMSQMKQRGDESCLDEHYELAVQALESHLMVVAVPQGGTNCPMVVADSGYTEESPSEVYEEGVPVLSKHLTILESNSVAEDEIKSMLFVGNVMSLKHFYNAVQIARTSANKDSSLHGIVGNCATFLLDVMTDLQIDFGKKDMQTNLINFVTQALMKSKERDTIVADIKGKINSHAVKAWVKLRGDNYLVKEFVEKFLKSYKIEKID